MFSAPDEKAALLEAVEPEALLEWVVAEWVVALALAATQV